jgi:hypothetical protein
MNFCKRKRREWGKCRRRNILSLSKDREGAPVHTLAPERLTVGAIGVKGDNLIRV